MGSVTSTIDCGTRNVILSVLPVTAGKEMGKCGKEQQCHHIESSCIRIASMAMPWTTSLMLRYDYPPHASFMAHMVMIFEVCDVRSHDCQLSHCKTGGRRLNFQRCRDKLQGTENHVYLSVLSPPPSPSGRPPGVNGSFDRASFTPHVPRAGAPLRRPITNQLRSSSPAL